MYTAVSSAACRNIKHSSRRASVNVCADDHDRKDTHTNICIRSFSGKPACYHLKHTSSCVYICCIYLPVYNSYAIPTGSLHEIEAHLLPILSSYNSTPCIHRDTWNTHTHAQLYKPVWDAQSPKKSVQTKSSNNKYTSPQPHYISYWIVYSPAIYHIACMYRYLPACTRTNGNKRKKWGKKTHVRRRGKKRKAPRQWKCRSRTLSFIFYTGSTQTRHLREDSLLSFCVLLHAHTLRPLSLPHLHMHDTAAGMPRIRYTFEWLSLG